VAQCCRRPFRDYKANFWDSESDRGEETIFLTYFICSARVLSNTCANCAFFGNISSKRTICLSRHPMAVEPAAAPIAVR
jgi:hypothetical protein